MERYGLIGRSLKHSLSKTYFTQRFAAESVAAEYIHFELGDISEIERVKQTPGLKGFNVTMPYKQMILPYLDALSEESRKTGAVNCVEIRETDGRKRFIGHNTDIIGFQRALRRFMPPSAARKALILGSGGASQAVRYALETLGISSVVVSRESEKEGRVSYPEMKHLMSSHPLIVNATPVGLFPDTAQSPPIPYKLLTPEHYLFDLIYNPPETLFMQRGKMMGARVCNGLDMFREQAAASWNIWKISGNDPLENRIFENNPG